jgi:hypothetical protein
MMTLTQANRVLVDPNRTYAQSAEAARVVGDHYRNLQLGGTAHTTDAYPKERHFFRDAARSRDDHKPDEDEEPKRGVHIHLHMADQSQAVPGMGWPPRGTDGTTTTGGDDPDSEAVGGEMVQVLGDDPDSDLGDFYLGTDPYSGKPALFRHPKPARGKSQTPVKSAGTTDAARLSAMLFARKKADRERATQRGKLAQLAQAAGG